MVSYFNQMDMYRRQPLVNTMSFPYPQPNNQQQVYPWYNRTNHQQEYQRTTAPASFQVSRPVWHGYPQSSSHGIFQNPMHSVPPAVRPIPEQNGSRNYIGNGFQNGTENGPGPSTTRHSVQPMARPIPEQNGSRNYIGNGSQNGTEIGPSPSTTRHSVPPTARPIPEQNGSRNYIGNGSQNGTENGSGPSTTRQSFKSKDRLTPLSTENQDEQASQSHLDNGEFELEDPEVQEALVKKVKAKNDENYGKFLRTTERYRAVYTEHQKLCLEMEYSLDKYITGKRKMDIAKHLDLNARQVKNWFQNRRAKDRKINKRSTSSPDEENNVTALLVSCDNVSSTENIIPEQVHENNQQSPHNLERGFQAYQQSSNAGAMPPGHFIDLRNFKVEPEDFISFNDFL